AGGQVALIVEAGDIATDERRQASVDVMAELRVGVHILPEEGVVRAEERDAIGVAGARALPADAERRVAVDDSWLEAAYNTRESQPHRRRDAQIRVHRDRYPSRADHWEGVIEGGAHPAPHRHGADHDAVAVRDKGVGEVLHAGRNAVDLGR